MNGDEVLRLRLANQRLAGAQAAEPGQVVAWLGAVQAQDFAGATWALGQRVPGSTGAQIEAAFDAGAILRTHVLRPTWHFVAPPDIRWLLALTAPRVRAAMRPYERQLGIDDDLVRRSNAAIGRALAGGRHLTRVELAPALAADGIAAGGPVLGHLAMRAELDGVICSGPRRGKQHTYALIEERAPAARARDRDEALAGLVERYFVGHGPATLRDFAWWSGLTIGDGRRGLAILGGRLVCERVDGREHWLAPRPAPSASGRPAPGTRPPPQPAGAYLLPNYDEYTVAYRDRELYFDAAAAAALPGRQNVPFDHAIVVGGRVVGLWRRTPGQAALTVATRLFAPADRADLLAAAGRYSRFLDQPVRLDDAEVTQN